MKFLISVVFFLLCMPEVMAAPTPTRQLTTDTEFSTFDNRLLPIEKNSPDSNMKVMDYLSVWKGILPKKWAVFKIQGALYKLKFYSQMPSGEENPEYTSAIKSFQSSLGATPTGELLVWQWAELIKRNSELFPTHFYPNEIYPESLNLSIEKDYISVIGTWQIQSNESEKFPYLQTSEVRCFRKANACVEANAMIIENQAKSGQINRDYLVVGSIIWNITNWDNQEVVAENDNYDCIKATFYVNLVAKKAYRLFRYYPGAGCSATSNNEPHMFDLVDGTTYAQGYYFRQKETSEKFYNPVYLEKVARLKNEK